MDFYNLSQQDFHVLEEKFIDDPELLNKKDSVSYNLIFLDNLKFAMSFVF